MSSFATLMDVKKFAVHDGPGIRTTFFLKGCSLKCLWCHNPEGISPRPEMALIMQKCVRCGACVPVCHYGAQERSNGILLDRSLCIACGACAEVCPADALKLYGRRIDVKEAVEIALEDRLFYETSDGGITVSGGEPLLQAEFVREFFEALKKEGIHTAVDTCGNVSWSKFETVLPYADMFLYDIKQIDSEKHQALTGDGNERILENLRKLSETGKRIEIRMPFVPGCNTDDETVSGIGAFLGKLNIEKMKVLPYHSMARSKYLSLGMKDTMPVVDPPTDEMIAHAVGILRSFGVNAVSGKD